MSDKEENDRVPLLRQKPVRLNYTKRYDQVSWHSADTDFEPEPSASSADERKKKIKKPVYSKRRKQKIAALVAVVVIFLSVMCGLIYVYLKQSDEFVEITCGKVSGDKEVVTNDDGIEKTFYIYKGIPFAEPPVKNNRWKRPVELSTKCWKDALKAKTFKSPCIGGFGKLIYGSEDCLYLDVYTPRAPLDEELNPVIVLFNTEISSVNEESNQHLPSSEFISEMETVLVNVNFRRDLLGFLSTETLSNTTSHYGNNGIADQIMSLQWVQNEIKKFGGNPNDVTIFSQTSGYALLSSPKAKGLFHKMFVFGASPNFEATYQDAFLQNNGIFKQCKASNSSDLMSCLNKISATEIQNSLYANHSNLRWELPDGLNQKDILITVEPNLVPFPPSSLGKTNQIFNIPVLIGNTAQETGLMSKTHPTSLKDLHKVVSASLGQINSTLTDYILEHLYNNKTLKSMNTDVLYQTIVSDIRVLCPTIKLKKEMSKSRKHIFYQYVLSGGNNGVVHGQDIQSIFTMGNSDPLYNVGRRLRTNLKHFIKYGHPNEFQWESSKIGLFDTNGDFETLSESYHAQQCEFFNRPENKLTKYSWRN